MLCNMFKRYLQMEIQNASQRGRKATMQDLCRVPTHSFSFINFTNAFLCTRPAYFPFSRTQR